MEHERFWEKEQQKVWQFPPEMCSFCLDLVRQKTGRFTVIWFGI